MFDEFLENAHAGSYTRRQQLFMRYTYATLVDLAVINLIAQYWDKVYIATFSISLLAAILLQVLLQASIALEHHVAGYFKKMSGAKARLMRALSTWFILFVSKLIILKAISLSFGDDVLFDGKFHGLIPFIVVVIAIIVAEQLFSRIYRSLG